MQNLHTDRFALRAWEKPLVFLLRMILFLLVRPFVGNPFPVWFARLVFRVGTFFARSVGKVHIAKTYIGKTVVETLRSEASQSTSHSFILYIHGGCFISCSPSTHRAITTRLARYTNSCVWAPDYRLAPEHPYPSGLDDCIECYKALLERNGAASKIVVVGDSAGGSLALALSLCVQRMGLPLPAGLMLISPMVALDEVALSYLRANALKKGITPSRRLFAFCDPILRNGAFVMSNDAYVLSGKNYHSLLTQDISALPPILVQVGSNEMLFDDAVVFAEHAATCGVTVKMEIYDGLWHVPHLFAAYIPTADMAIARLAMFFREIVDN